MPLGIGARLGALVTLLLVALAPLRAAQGHAALVRSEPADGASLTQPPPVIRAWFTEALAVRGSVIRLYDSHETLLATGGVDTRNTAHTVMVVRPPHLRPGTYVVRWYAVSADDGAVRRGLFRFSVAPAGALPPLRLVAPQDRARLRNPVTVVVEIPGDIDRVTMGGRTEAGAGVHLHLSVDHQVFMPTSSQLRRIGPARYAFPLPPLSAGTHTIRVFWADDAHHRTVGAVHSVTCTVL